MKFFINLILVFLTFSFHVAAEKRVLSVVGPQANMDASHHYYIHLLKQILKESNTQFELKEIGADDLTHGRSLKLLKHEFIDVFWAGTSIKREKEYLAIKIPLVKGLLGYRVSIINKNNKKLFKGKELNKLKQRFACQGSHWPDTDILEANGFQVVPAARLDSMFKMVNAGNCDYFPRAIFEGYGELAAIKNEMPDLQMSDSFLLHYPFPIYFFVHKSNFELAKVLQQGLLKLIESGELDTLIETHPLTQHLYPLEQWSKKQIIKLENPLLPKDTDTTNPKFWLKL